MSSLIESDHVFTNPLLKLELMTARRRFQSAEQFWEWSSHKIGRWVLRSGWGRGNALFGFVRNIDPRVCEVARDNGLIALADQMIAPSIVERAQYYRERERWPGWELTRNIPEFERVEAVEHATWSAVDHLTCGSDYVRNGLIAAGVPADRVTTIPYPVMMHPPGSHQLFRQETRRHNPITVGFVGGVGLRKGAPYFLNVARRFSKKFIRFVMIGPVSISSTALADLRSVVDVVGAVPRSEIATWLNRFDAFLFPSTCEGSAGAVSEAMAAGLPVIVSPESGSVVRDGIDGFVVPYDDIDAMAERLERLISDPSIGTRLGHAAEQRSSELDSIAYTRALVAIYSHFLENRVS
jgi:glycosyltransferase involved in cell wall biosynthesis